MTASPPVATLLAAPAPVAAPVPSPVPASALGPRYSVHLARDEADVAAAQRLRYEVFAGEMGAVLHTPAPGLDIDPFDAHCDHLLVRERRTGAVVGTYRLLPPGRAAAAGSLYSDTEFDLSGLAGIRADLVEVGRSCVHPDHRDGTVVALIWGGITRYMLASGHNWLAGCCSVPLADGGGSAAAVWDAVAAKYLSPEAYRVRPHRPWDRAAVGPVGRAPLPALLRGYVRLGAWICGEPAHDPDFGVADLFVLLSLERTDPRYLRHFMSLETA